MTVEKVLAADQLTELVKQAGSVYKKLDELNAVAQDIDRKCANRLRWAREGSQEAYNQLRLLKIFLDKGIDGWDAWLESKGLAHVPVYWKEGEPI